MILGNTLSEDTKYYKLIAYIICIYHFWGVRFFFKLNEINKIVNIPPEYL